MGCGAVNFICVKQNASAIEAPTPTPTPILGNAPRSVPGSNSCRCNPDGCGSSCGDRSGAACGGPQDDAWCQQGIVVPEPPAAVPPPPSGSSVTYPYAPTGARCTYLDSDYQHGFCTPTGDPNLWLYCNDGGFAQTPKNSSICPYPGQSGISCIGNGFKRVDFQYDCCNGQPTVNEICGGGAGSSSYTPPQIPQTQPPPAQPPASSGCGNTCVYTQDDGAPGVRCHEGNCTNSDCGFNKNCSWISGCSSGAVVTCP